MWAEPASTRDAHRRRPWWPAGAWPISRRGPPTTALRREISHRLGFECRLVRDSRLLVRRSRIVGFLLLPGDFPLRGFALIQAEGASFRQPREGVKTNRRDDHPEA